MDVKRALIILLAAYFLAGVVVAVQAGGFDEALSIASVNVPPGADVAGMGNAWVATPNFSSNNPAILPTYGDYKIGGSATYGRINFKKGPEINSYSGSVAAKLPAGFLQITYSNACSSTEATEMGVGAKFNSSPVLNIQYGLSAAKNFLRQGDELFMGLSYSPHESLGLTFSSAGENLLRSKSSGHSYGTGFLYKPDEKWNIGGYYSRSRSKNKNYDLISGEESRSASRTEQLRLGLGYQVAPLTFLAFDYQHLNLDGAKKDQYFAGIEQGIVKDIFYLYAGWADSGSTAGIGVYFKNGGINVAYMRSPFNDLEPHLGRAEVIMATAYLNF